MNDCKPRTTTLGLSSAPIAILALTTTILTAMGSGCAGSEDSIRGDWQRLAEGRPADEMTIRDSLQGEAAVGTNGAGRVRYVVTAVPVSSTLWPLCEKMDGATYMLSYYQIENGVASPNTTFCCMAEGSATLKCNDSSIWGGAIWERP